MLRSMTGQGQARCETPLGSFAIELRTVNNRFFKLSPRWSEGLASLEGRAEALIRTRVIRGTMNLSATWSRASTAGYRIHEPTLEAYFNQLQTIRKRLGAPVELDLVRMTELPGVVETCDGDAADPELLWETFSKVLEQALEALDRMRAIEGESMGKKLHEDLQVIADQLQKISGRAPTVVDQYRERLQARIESGLKQFDIRVQPTDLLREIQLFADRSDISEEITRLSSHIEMFRRAAGEDSAAGRKLDFVIQEMFREANTIGSKANDAEIAGYVVEIKCAIERMRELVQNLE